ncbi:MAG: hypothetical protein Q9214_005192, partial [Letrouitia sp. 1 TL-2023]
PVKMQLGGLFIPPEVIRMITSYLPTAAIQNIRLSCKAGNDEVSPFLLQSIYFSAQPQDLENLTKISEHPVFSKSVKKIVFDATSYALPMLSKRKYGLLFRPKKNSGHHIRFSRSAVTRGYDVYRDKWLAHITALAHFGFLRLNLSLDPWCFFSNYWEYGVDLSLKPRGFGFMPIFQMRLEEALKRMPRVTQLAVSDQRWLSHPQHYRYFTGRREIYDVISFSVHSKGIRYGDKVVLDPGPWPYWDIHEEPTIYERDDIFQQGEFITKSSLVQILPAAVMANMRMPEHLEIDVQSKWAGLSDSSAGMFQLGSRCSKLIHQAFANLKTVQLHMHRFQHGAAGFEITSSLAIALTSAKHLEHLEVTFNSETVWLNKDTVMLGDQLEMVWPKLHTVKLCSMLLIQDKFLDFLRLHAQSIKHISLKAVNFSRIGRDFHHRIVNEPKNRANIRPYREFLTMLASLPLSLSELTIRPVTCKSQPWYHACDSDSVSRLLRSGGEKGSVDNCVHAEDDCCSIYCNTHIG